MALLGNGWDDPQSQAIMALSGGLLSANGSQGLGAGLLGANQAMQAAKAQALKEQMLRMQMEEVKAQADERKAKMAMAQRAQDNQTRLLYGDPSGTPGGVSAGAFAAPTDGVGPTMPQGAAPQAGGLVARARALGMPDDIIQSDIAFNGGKKISEFINSRTAPKWENINGNLLNTNEPGFKGGFQPGFSVSADGKATAWQPDGRGGLVFGAPRGAVDTFNAYARTGEAAKADFDPVTVTPQGQNPQMTTRGALVRNPQVQGGGNQGPADPATAGRVEILQQEVGKARAQLKTAMQAGDAAATNRATTDLSSLSRELRALGVNPQQAQAASVGMPLQSKAEEVKAEADAKAAADRDAVRQKGAVNSADTMNYIKEARKLFEKGPTASGIGSAVDTVAGIFGKSTPGADAAAQLDTLSGWMVSNVPRMEGPQSNFDVQNYKTMAGMVGDKTKPLSQRMAALDTLEKLQAKYAHLNSGGSANTGGAASGGWSIQKVN